MTWTAPTAAAFKTYFARDFNFAPTSDPDNLDFVTDGDIERAFTEASVHFNDSLFGTDTQVTAAYMYLAAFQLISNIQNSAKGLSSQSKFPINSTSVGGVSINFSIPERYINDPALSQYTQNGYGMKYLALAIPFLVGNVTVYPGATTWW